MNYEKITKKGKISMNYLLIAIEKKSRDRKVDIQLFPIINSSTQLSVWTLVTFDY